MTDPRPLHPAFTEPSRSHWFIHAGVRRGPAGWQLGDEPLEPVDEAVPNHLPRRRNKPPHKTTVFRWMSAGFRGVKLPYLKIGNTRYTTLSALQWWIEQMNREQSPATILRASPAQPDRQVEALDQVVRATLGMPPVERADTGRP